jgi:alpha/beta superfamily hydrolase
MHVPIETVTLEALDAVQIEADLIRVDDARASVVLMHPHPLYGGDRFNPLIESLFQALPALGATTIRLDFRGVNNSGGVHDNGDSERLDVLAAVELVELIEMGRDIPLWLIGYSFGAYVALNVVDPRVAAWVAIAPPLAAMNARCIADHDHRTKLLFVPEHDQFSPPSATAEFTRDWVACTQHTIGMADHFMNGRIDAVTQQVCRQLFGTA